MLTKEELIKKMRKYKRNKSRLFILENNLVTDDDYTLGAIDYSKDKIQTSNISNLDTIIARREKEKEQLKKDIMLVDAVMNSFDSRKDSMHKKLIESYYIENMTQRECMEIIKIYDNKYFFTLCSSVVNGLLELVI